MTPPLDAPETVLAIAPRSVTERLRRPDLELRAGAASAGGALANVAARALRRGVGRMLTTSEHVTSAAEGIALLGSDEHPEVVADQLQRGVMAALPMLRLARRGRWFARVPVVVVVSTAVSTGMTVRRGIRELQVVAALLDHRLEQATGAIPDPELVQALTVALYRDPRHVPRPEPGHLRLVPVARRWALRGALGRDTGPAAARALAAAERLDVAAQAARWAAPRPVVDSEPSRGATGGIGPGG